jgi:hypothetical protein
VIKLRWLNKYVKTQIEINPGSYGGPMMDSTEIIRILQYSEAEGNGTLPESYDYAWSDWTDIPEVIDD